MPLAISVRNLFQFLVGIVAALMGAVASRAEAPPQSSSRVEVLTMSAFVARIRQDTGLRARFAQNPRAVLREFGIDPTAINLPDRLTEAQLQGLLNGRTVDVREGRPVLAQAKPSPPAPVYGPPSTPAPVYGPPATPPPQPEKPIND
jgi:hypothetical protein